MLTQCQPSFRWAFPTVNHVRDGPGEGWMSTESIMAGSSQAEHAKVLIADDDPVQPAPLKLSGRTLGVSASARKASTTRGNATRSNRPNRIVLTDRSQWPRIPSLLLSPQKVVMTALDAPLPSRRTWLQQISSGIFALAASGVCLRTAEQAAQSDEPPLRWFKGNLHTHSLWSDGNDFPEMICDWYKSKGYHFLALSDHNILSEGQKWLDLETVAKRGAAGGFERYVKRFGDDWVELRSQDDKRQVRLKPLNEFRPLFDEPGKFLLIQGEELTDSFNSLPIHINASNIRDLIKPQGGGDLRTVLANNLIAIEQQAQRVGQPILAHLNHPNFGYAVTAEDLAAVIQERFFEIYNGHPDVHHEGDAEHASLERMWDVANTIRVAEMRSPPLFGLGVDDSHQYFGERGATPGRGWIMVRARRLTPSALIAAIQAGDFYASSGVTLDEVRYDEAAGTLTVRAQDRPGKMTVTEFVGTRTGYDRKSAPVVDASGKEIRATRRYSADVGRVLAKVEGVEATYKMRGDELYVRAVVTQFEPPEVPSFKEQMRQAWTQPVGWLKRLAPAPASSTPMGVR